MYDMLHLFVFITKKAQQGKKNSVRYSKPKRHSASIYPINIFGTKYLALLLKWHNLIASKIYTKQEILISLE
jgi:hypothetical protein